MWVIVVITVPLVLASVVFPCFFLVQPRKHMNEMRRDFLAVQDRTNAEPDRDVRLLRKDMDAAEAW